MSINSSVIEYQKKNLDVDVACVAEQNERLTRDASVKRMPISRWLDYWDFQLHVLLSSPKLLGPKLGNRFARSARKRFHSRYGDFSDFPTLWPREAKPKLDPED